MTLTYEIARDYLNTLTDAEKDALMLGALSDHWCIRHFDSYAEGYAHGMGWTQAFPQDDYDFEED